MGGRHIDLFSECKDVSFQIASMLTRGLAPLRLRYTSTSSCRRAQSCYRAQSYSIDASRQAYLEPSGSRVEGITFLSLDRPKAKNAISQQLLAELGEAVDRVGSDRSVLLLMQFIAVYCIDDE